MRHRCLAGILLAALAFAGSAQLSAQDAVRGDWQRFLSSDGVTVYDLVNNFVWLADANLAAKTLPDFENFRFGLQLCDVPDRSPAHPCVNASGSMSYTSAEAWVKAMKAHQYLGHLTNPD